MFTGIVRGVGEIKSIEGQGVKRFVVRTPWFFARGMKLGASVAFDGVCLTVVGRGLRSLTVDVMDETLRLTTFGRLTVGDRVNLERSFRVGDEIGGHILSGHISGMAEILEICTENETTVLRFLAPETLAPYLVEKGFVGLNGASLTITNLRDASFDVYLIPETLLRTTFGEKRVRDKINIEVYRGML